MLGISRLEADGPPAPLYPPGNPLPLCTTIHALPQVCAMRADMRCMLFVPQADALGHPIV